MGAIIRATRLGSGHAREMIRQGLISPPGGCIGQGGRLERKLSTTVRPSDQLDMGTVKRIVNLRLQDADGGIRYIT